MEIMEILTRYADLYPHSKLTDNDNGMLLYAEAISDLHPLAIEGAFKKLLQTCKFFPSVAEVREEAEKLTAHVSGSEELTASEAWEEVMDNVRKHGVYSKWEYSTPDVERAVRQFGGAIDLCSLEMNLVGVARAQFMKIYDSVIARKTDRKKNDKALQMLAATAGANRVQAFIAQVAGEKALLEG